MKSIKVNAVYNVLKQICAIIFPLITFSYASHVLGSGNIGALSFAQSIISYAGLFAALGISTYSIREGTIVRNDKEKFERLASQLFSINIITTTVTLIVLFIITWNWERIQEYRSLISILSLSIIFSTIGVSWINTIYEDFKYLTIRYIIVQAIALICMFLFVKNEESIIAYTWITLLATSGGEILNVFYVRRFGHIRFTLHMNIKQHIVPLITLFVTNLAVIIYVNSDITIITLLLGNEEAGVYSAATKIYQAVKHLLFALVTVMIPRLSYLTSKGEKREREGLVNSTVKYLHFLVFPSIIGLFIEGRNIICVFSGIEYETGKTALRILCFAIIFATWSNIYNSGVLLVEKQEKKMFILTFIACVTNILLNFIFVPIYGISGAAITTLIAEMINGVGSVWCSRKYIQTKMISANTYKEIIGCVGIIIVCLVVKLFNFSSVLEIVITVPMSIVIYILMMLLLKHTVMMDLANKYKANKLLKKSKRDVKSIQDSEEGEL